MPPSTCDPFRQNHKRFLADCLLDKYSDISGENLFLSVGKITPWPNLDDKRIPSSDSVKDNIDFWRGIVAAKRINRSDVSLVIRRIDWQPGRVYDPYRDNVDLFPDNTNYDFYVLVDDERVYVCIDNFGGQPSQYAPTHTDSVIRKLADGYRWKYLYTIPESKRTFLTRSDTGSVGYMPVEYVDGLLVNDDRNLQWLVQEAAVNGKIDFVYVDDPIKLYWVTTQSCILPNDDNVITTHIAAGATQAIISSNQLGTLASLYTDMVFSVETGPGQGQRRVIKEFEWIGGGNAKIGFDALVSGLSGVGADTPSTWSITPKVAVVGDGFGTSVINPTIKTADIAVKFGETVNLPADACSNYVPRLVSSIEIIDGGRDYTFATLDIPKGITTLADTPETYQSITPYLHAVIPPNGGHGSNPVHELGAKALMIIKGFDGEESGKIDVDNDYRQVGILRNPLLSREYEQVRLKFYQPGLSGTFTVGLTAGYGTGPYGTVLEWCRGLTGVTGTSELVLGNVTGGTYGGTFTPGATVGTLKVYDVFPITHAGQEARHLLDLRLTSVNVTFDENGRDYSRNLFANGVGNLVTNIPRSRSNGQIFCWEPDGGTNKFGTLSLEFPKGNFNIGESVLQTTPTYHVFGTSTGYTGPGVISSISTHIENLPTAYDLTTTVKIVGDNFDDGTFLPDSQVFFANGLTSDFNGYIVDWIPAVGGTSGTIRMTGVQGSVLTGQSVLYTTLGASGTTESVSGTLSQVIHLGEFKYNSGEILYIQNMDPIVRDLEQKEEFKLVFEL
mgnify:CR=1 FL=1